ncbi:hypothetical protein HNP38_001737 [Chryseobacterium defluvii]|uniref:Uncharacterized protein n=1 Tax=Chryseobacterium defluvii TaxID=160396 RepID=A0A840KAI2_9FLAO|nr:hypothetical protein [Chryseobacterium defluvii]
MRFFALPRMTKAGVVYKKLPQILQITQMIVFKISGVTYKICGRSIIIKSYLLI